MKSSNKNSLWIKYLEVVSIIFALQGLSWAIVGTFDPWGVYEGFLAEFLNGGSTLGESERNLFAFILVPFGATDAGFFVLIYFLTKHGIRANLLWSFQTSVTETEY